MESIRWACNFGKWLPTREQWIKANRCIQVEEQERIARFAFAKDAKAALVGRLLLRKLIAEQLGIPYVDILLGRTDKGKPYLLNSMHDCYNKWSFNVSHNGEYCVLAAEQNSSVGVDVMKVEYTGGKSVEEFFQIMKRQFTDKEWKTIRSPETEALQLKMFFRHWCLKESVVKALGVGVGFQLQRLSFVLTTHLLCPTQVTSDTMVEVDGCINHSWTFEESMLDDMHSVAVAVKSPVGTGREKGSLFQNIPITDILNNISPLRPPSENLWDEFCIKPNAPS